MADNKEKHDIGHAMFGLGDPEPASGATPVAGTGQRPGAAPQGSSFGQPPPQQSPPAPQQPPAPGQSPQYVYVQGPPPDWAQPPATQGGRNLTKWVIILAVLIGANLALAI